MRRSIILLVVCITFFAEASSAAWTLISNLSAPVNCGFFYDANKGFLGGGSLQGGRTYPLSIWRTYNGGTNWILCNTPAGNGRVTNITMLDNNLGYASIYSPNYSLWRTTDGGINWVDITGIEYGNSTCVYVTPYALMKTMWTGVNGPNFWDGGGFSVNGGATFNHTFRNFGYDSFNAIDFVDDFNGVITPGPVQNVRCIRTSDGGRTWQAGGNHTESWGLYALKGTSTFFTLGEGNSQTPDRTVRISNDYGNFWSTRYSFANTIRFTGAIAGKCSTLYVQTTNSNLGLYRSDDLGVSWKNIRGPANARDTRFVVTGLRGEVVYAFDNRGGVYKTTDGGDGTLVASAGSSQFSFFPSFLNFTAKDCKTLRQYLTITTPLCTGFIVDSLYIKTGKSIFTIDSITNYNGAKETSIRVPILYRSDSNGSEIGSLRLRAHAGAVVIDTLIPLAGNNTSQFTLSYAPDTLAFSAKNCLPERQYLSLSAIGCSGFTIDTAYIANRADLFRVDTNISFSGKGGTFFSIPIIYRSDTNITERGMMRIKAHSGKIVIDTLIPLEGTNTSDFQVSLFPDSLQLATKNCLPIRSYITLTATTCIGYTIDTCYLSGGENTFSIDTNVTIAGIVPTTMMIPVRFQSDSDGSKRASIHLRAHSGNVLIDTVIYLEGTNDAPFAISVFPDTLNILTKDCIPEREYITLTSSICSGYTIDTCYISSGGAVFTLDTNALIRGTGASAVQIPVRFQYDSNGILSGTLRLRAHCGAKTIDTLIPLIGNNRSDFKLFFFPDTAFIYTAYCQPEQASITFSTPLCSDMKIDTLYVASSEGEFWMNAEDAFASISPQSVRLPVWFEYGREATRSGVLHIRASRGSLMIDTTIPLVGKNVTAPEPYLGEIAKRVVGDTVHIPVYLKATQDTFTIKRFTVHLSYNTDILSYKDFEVENTLALPIENASYLEDAKGVTFQCEMQKSITRESDLSKPLITLVMRSFLSRMMETSVRLDTLSIGSQPPQPLCTIPERIFSIQYECGDSVLVKYLRDSSLPQLFPITPNPASEGHEIVVKAYLPIATSATIDVIDMKGNTLIRGEEQPYKRGTRTMTVPTHALPSGAYLARLKLGNGMKLTTQFLIVR